MGLSREISFFPYRKITALGCENPERRIIAVIPELVERRWFQWLLHTKRAEILEGRLLMDDRISVLNIPGYSKSKQVQRVTPQF